MVAALGDPTARLSLLERLPKAKDRNTALGIVAAVVHLAPQGDGVASNAIFGAIPNAGTAPGIEDDELYLSALKLWARAQ